jgi:hypothetical protein
MHMVCRDAVLVLWSGEAWDLEAGLRTLQAEGQAPDLVVQPYLHQPSQVSPHDKRSLNSIHISPSQHLNKVLSTRPLPPEQPLIYACLCVS